MAKTDLNRHHSEVIANAVRAAADSALGNEARLARMLLMSLRTLYCVAEEINSQKPGIAIPDAISIAIDLFMEALSIAEPSVVEVKPLGLDKNKMN